MDSSDSTFYSPRRLVVAAARRLRLANLARRLGYSRVDRPHYAYCVYHSAMLARRLGYRSISVIEFGVAGGSGLLALEEHARAVSIGVNIDIEVYGFDSGRGLPPPEDYRDLPYHWKSGFFGMEEDKLRRRLATAELVLGDIRETVNSFFSTYNPSPIAAIIFDLDFYSSTVAALSVFDVDEKHRLPRIFCYFDDIIGGESELYNDYTGVRLAIEEFNESHDMQKLSSAYHLVSRNPTQQWYHQIYILHDFDHSRYNDFISAKSQQLPLE